MNVWDELTHVEGEIRRGDNAAAYNALLNRVYPALRERDKVEADLLEALRDLVACAEMLEEFTDPNSDGYTALLEAQNALVRAEETA